MDNKLSLIIMKHAIRRATRSVILGGVIVVISILLSGGQLLAAEDIDFSNTPATPYSAPAPLKATPIPQDAISTISTTLPPQVTAQASPVQTRDPIYVTRYLPDILQEAQGPADMVFLIYKYLMGLVGIVAVGVIMYGGVLRTVSADPSKIRASNEYIKNALKGIVLLFGAQVLFNTINPNIIDIGRIQRALQPSERLVPGALTGTDIIVVGDRDMMAATSSFAGSIDTRTGTSNYTAGTVTASNARAGLDAIDGISMLPPCAPGGTTRGCISFQGVQQQTIDSIAMMAEAGIPIQITSITEGQHAAGDYSHANGYKWDMAPIPESHFASKPDQFEKIATRSDSTATYRDKVTGAICSLEKPPAPAHWDCSVRPDVQF